MNVVRLVLQRSQTRISANSSRLQAYKHVSFAPRRPISFLSANNNAWNSSKTSFQLFSHSPSLQLKGIRRRFATNERDVLGGGPIPPPNTAAESNLGQNVPPTQQTQENLISWGLNTTADGIQQLGNIVRVLFTSNKVNLFFSDCRDCKTHRYKRIFVDETQFYQKRVSDKYWSYSILSVIESYLVSSSNGCETASNVR